MDTGCHRGKNRKYAANSKYAEHTGMPQRLYLRFLCAKRAVCSGVPEFAAYFRRAIPEVRGKTEIDRPASVLPFHDLRFCCRKSGCARRFPIFPRTSGKHGLHREVKHKKVIRDNWMLSRKHQRAVAGKPNNDPSLSPPHVESTATASLRTFYRNIKQPNKATIGNAVVHPKFHLNKTRGCPPLERNPLAKRWPIAGFHLGHHTAASFFRRTIGHE